MKTHLVTLILAALVLSGCEDHPARMGVGVDQEGELIAKFRSCKTDTVLTYARLKDLQATARDASDDIVLWEVEGETAATTELLIDEEATVDGLEVMTQFDGSDLAGKLLRLTYRTSSLTNGESLDFHYDDLRVDQTLTPHGFMSHEDFKQRVRCG
ncbi:MAG: hypothetical protein IT303_00600 [Dehalococcoidia bacterium]|nr:hypothetical protein [Dehalococcoidia bacterium]